MKDDGTEIYEPYVRLPLELMDSGGMDYEAARNLRLIVSDAPDELLAHDDRFLIEKENSALAFLKDARALLTSLRREWEEERNPLVALEAFLVAYKGGLFPPLWALKWFCERLEEWHKSNDKTRLDEALGLRPKGKGKWPAFKKALQADFHDKIRRNVGMLRCVGLTLDDAAKRVAADMAREVADKGCRLDATGWNVARVLDRDTIKDLCKGDNPFADWPPEIIEKWRAQKDEILRRFPAPDARTA